MQDKIDKIAGLYHQWSGQTPDSVDVLQQAGSERRYFRVWKNGQSVIGTYGANIKENESFFYFSDHFQKRQLPVANILAISADRMYYLQDDYGNISLINHLEEQGETAPVYELFKNSLGELARVQVLGDKGLDYDKCLTNKEFGKQAIMADLLYFKYYFLDALRKPYDKQALIDDFEALSTYLTHTDHKFFMMRDFQSRNIQVMEDRSVHFIDYQGGMKGAPQYDVASLLWQARANLSEDWKERLLVDYMHALEPLLDKPLNRTAFVSQYNGYVLIRLLQVLGAYGFRGLFERKAHFLTSIPLALRNLRAFLHENAMGISVPEFDKVLQLCIADEIIEQFTPVQATAATPLVVKVSSFSFKKGLPAADDPDSDRDGGGFVFDCRGILNPGRIESMKTQTGRDKEVIQYLEQQTRMPEFLHSVFDVVDITVEDFIKRGFSSLMVSFGCTGGQHRSVYAADALARHLKNKFKVKVALNHWVQDAKNWENSGR
ncbi:RapZ C-terminal domain-containing protein [Niabella drilacis]|uniref:RNase adaptor protein for sRNA GlmZ degradation, contains a P-loop ATPase domain n=1 Tax=Niabella drilacis (strain DSM 25811 / CCM 8410 / CCUG 62505 / LMG 26954 / E90) TaxID=1285928 RepID=A0A1G6NMH1_NIADE|nr:RNase adapter RapZ [Niabella drilacis]SDC68851.1 RNase adaptor protein for sRNA GlmZ degradation, contains a P-loop ATPase domain [Niabella drilacis]